MPREDKVAFGLIMLVAGLIIFGLIWGAARALELLGIGLGAASAGVGFRDAFLVSVPLAFVIILIMAIFAGDGMFGELGLMLIGFFLMLIFFTLSIAILF